MEVGKQYKWSEKKILVVEDDESSAMLLKEILKGTGARVKYTTLGGEAVEYMRKNPHTDLILMDIQLPDKDGLTATREIKSFAGDVVVIAQTAYSFLQLHPEVFRKNFFSFQLWVVKISVVSFFFPDKWKKQSKLYQSGYIYNLQMSL